MPARISFFWVQVPQRALGWSENFYTSANSLEAGVDVANALLPKLAGIHGYQSVVPAYRVSLLDSIGRSIRTSYLVETAVYAGHNDAAPTYVTTAFKASSDYPTTALLLRGTATTGQKTSQWIHGAPDEVVVQGGSFSPGAIQQFQTNLADLLAFLNSGSSTIKTRVLAALPGKILVTDIALATGVVTLAAPHGLTGPTPVRLGGIRGSAGLETHPNRVYKGIPVALNTVKLIHLARFFDPLSDVTDAYVRPQVYAFQDAKWNVQRVTGRQVGAPFGRVAGRRKTRT